MVFIENGITLNVGSSNVLLSGCSRNSASYVLSVDTAGQESYTREFLTLPSGPATANVKRTPDGGFVGVIENQDSNLFFKYDANAQLIYREKLKRGLPFTLNVFEDGSVAHYFLRNRFSTDSLVKLDPNTRARMWGFAFTGPTGGGYRYPWSYSYYNESDVLITGKTQDPSMSPGFFDAWVMQVRNFGWPFSPFLANKLRLAGPAWLGILPNPVGSVLSISCSAPPKHSQIYSSNGQLVASFSGFTCAVATLPPGLYLVVCTLANGRQATAKMLKE